MKKKSTSLATVRKEAEERLRQQTERLKGISMLDMQDLVHELGTHQIELEMQNEELRRAQEELEASRSRYADLYDSAPTSYLTLDRDGVILEVNLAGAGLLGEDRRRLIKKPFTVFVFKDDLDTFRAHLKETLTRETRQIGEIRIRGKDGSVTPVQLQSIAAGGPGGNSTFCRTAAIDITERKRMEEAIRHQAHHDPLTHLPNRLLLMNILAIELAKARRGKKRFAVLFLDLDRFKYINDTLGHDIGDQLLKQVAERLRRSVRASDTVSRMGGDEFNILLTEIAQADDIITISQKVVDSFGKSYLIGRHEFHTSASIGISIYPEDGDTMEELFKNADTAMYHAKEQGGNSYQFFNTAMNTRLIERMRLERWLRQALHRAELEVYYQPQFTIDTRQVMCAEALVRWRHPELGILAPGRFLPIAEEIGLINAIDEWVLKTTCAQFKEWQDAGLPRLGATINLSAKQIQKPDFVERIAGILRETGFDPGHLEVEISESVAMRNLEQAIPNMTKLTEMGVGISIDNFGTGYSSLNYLKKLPIRKIKIDKSFIQGIAAGSADKAIIGAVTALARDMKLRVVAVGVETEEQLDFLKSTGCQEMQGFLFSRPLPAGEFRGLIAMKK
ncbi:MAG: EAL domain-containing protein [Deltaproteobacteria bacterium]|nr:EAL domain-containing protein [Deltaproteobacteria bacterium]